MRAVTFTDRLAFDARHADAVPAEGEALIRVHYAGICATDRHILAGYMGFRGVLGHEMVGTVIHGSPVWHGKRVVCEINAICRRCDMCQRGLSSHCRRRTVMGIAGRDGCFADLVAMPERNLHTIPDAISDEEAVFVEPLAAAYQVLVQCPIDSRQSVCVLGSGRLGLLVAQVLKSTSCNLMVVGRNREKLLICEKRGIQTFHTDDLVARQDKDVVVECTGSTDGLKLAAQLVRPRGTIVLKSTCAGTTPVELASIVVNEVRVLGSRCGPFPEAIHALARQAVDVRSMISRVFPIEEAAEAFAALSRPQTMKVLLKINPR